MKKLVAVTVALIALLCMQVTVFAAFQYEHDPMENPRAAEDIVLNPDAVYGYSPNPDSTRLGEYADLIDWTDPEQVAGARAKREAYHAELEALYDRAATMVGEGKSTEEIARALSQLRNEIRLEASADNPEELAAVKQSNLETYGNENGPTIDWLYAKYGSWETIIEKSMSSNPGMDACVGLYDEMYYTYDIAHNTPSPATGEQSSLVPFWILCAALCAGGCICVGVRRSGS